MAGEPPRTLGKLLADAFELALDFPPVEMAYQKAMRDMVRHGISTMPPACIEYNRRLTLLLCEAGGIPGVSELGGPEADWQYETVVQLATLLEAEQQRRSNKSADAGNGQPAADGSTAAKPKRRRWRKANYQTEQREAKIAADWKRAHATGVCKSDFAKEKEMIVATLDTLLDRVAKRQSRSDN